MRHRAGPWRAALNTLAHRGVEECCCCCCCCCRCRSGSGSGSGSSPGAGKWLVVVVVVGEALRGWETRCGMNSGAGRSGAGVPDLAASCYPSRKMSAVGLGSRFDFLASITRNSISDRSRRANDSAIIRATSWWCMAAEKNTTNNNKKSGIHNKCFEAGLKASLSSIRLFSASWTSPYVRLEVTASNTISEVINGDESRWQLGACPAAVPQLPLHLSSLPSRHRNRAKRKTSFDIVGTRFED